jgi:hypothetical protein
MAETARAPSIWSLDGTTGTLDCGRLSGKLDVARPHVGLHQPAFDSDSSPCTFFGVRRTPEQLPPEVRAEHGDKSWWPLEVADSYVRGNDLVASYQPTEAWPYAPQIYWRANPSPTTATALASMSLLVSVQTPLLDTHPKISVASQIPSSELYLVSVGSDRAITTAGASCCIVWRLLTAPLSYVEFMPATDFQQVTCSPSTRGTFYAEWHLFSEFLEKGVIRRARVHGALLPRKNDIELAIECCSEFEHSPPPLTT